MSAWPEWDVKVEWPTPQGYAIDLGSGREAYYGPLAEPGTPDQATADRLWGPGNYGGWTQPDGRVTYYNADQLTEVYLAAIDAPTNQLNLTAMNLWAQSEGMPNDARNPLANMNMGYGAVGTPGRTAPTYPSVFASQMAWVATITQGGYQYEDIIAALRAGDNLAPIWHAINASAWCRGCQGGYYPTALYSAANTGAGVTERPPNQPPPAPPPGPAVNIPGLTEVEKAWDTFRDSIHRHIPNAIDDLANISVRSPTGGQ